MSKNKLGNWENQLCAFLLDSIEIYWVITKSQLVRNKYLRSNQCANSQLNLNPLCANFTMVKYTRQVAGELSNFPNFAKFAKFSTKIEL